MEVFGQGGSGSAVAAIATAVVRHADGTQTLYQSSGNTAALNGTMIQSAFAALLANETLEIGPCSANITSTLVIPSGAVVRLNGTQLASNITNLTMFSATAQVWSLIGTAGATLTGQASGSENAISITTNATGNAWSVSGLKLVSWNGIGIAFVSGAIITDHSNGSVTDLICFSCGGTAVDIPAVVEYIRFTNITINAGGTGIACAGGNNQFCNGSILNTTVCAFDLKSGTNDSHGCMTNFLINHNGGYGVRLRGIANGFQFVNCDFFANNPGSNQIAIDGCVGVQFIGGILATQITFLATPTGPVMFQGMQVNTTSTTFGTYTDYQRGFVKFYNCFTLTGPLTGYPVGNDGFDGTMGGTGSNIPFVASAIPFVDPGAAILRQDAANFARDGGGNLTINGPIAISTNNPAGADGSMTIVAGDNTRVPWIVKGKADTVTPALYPSAISPAVWIAADRIAAAPLGKITSITDLSGNGRHFTGSNGGGQIYPTLVPNVLNGLPVIRFTGVAFQNMDTASFTLAQSVTVFCVFKKATANNKVLFTDKGASAVELLGFAASTATMFSGSSATVNLTPTNWNIGVFVFNGASSSYRINTGGSATTVNPGATGIANGFRLADFSSGGFPYDGDIAELIVAATPTAAQIEGLVQYLSNKWGVALGAQGTAGASAVQTGDLAQWQLPAGGVLLKLDASGRICKGAGATTPGIAAGAGAGTSPTVGATGKDQAGQISVLTGSSPTASAVVATLTFANTWGATPNIILTPANAAAAALSGNAAVFISSPGTGSFAVSVGSTQLGAATTYLWNYFVIG